MVGDTISTNDTISQLGDIVLVGPHNTGQENIEELSVLSLRRKQQNKSGPGDGIILSTDRTKFSRARVGQRGRRYRKWGEMDLKVEIQHIYHKIVQSEGNMASRSLKRGIREMKRISGKK